MSMNAGYEVPAISSVCLETTKWSRRFAIWKFSCEFYLLHCYRNFILFSWSILCADPEGLVIWNETMDWRLKEINLIGDASMRARKTWKIKIKNNFKKWNWIQLNQETDSSKSRRRLWRCTRLELTLSVSECINAYPNPLKKLGHSSRNTCNIFHDHPDHIQVSTEHFWYNQRNYSGSFENNQRLCDKKEYHHLSQQ